MVMRIHFNVSHIVFILKIMLASSDFKPALKPKKVR